MGTAVPKLISTQRGIQCGEKECVDGMQNQLYNECGSAECSISVTIETTTEAEMGSTEISSIETSHAVDTELNFAYDWEAETAGVGVHFGTNAGYSHTTSWATETGSEKTWATGKATTHSAECSGSVNPGVGTRAKIYATAEITMNDIPWTGVLWGRGCDPSNTDIRGDWEEHGPTSGVIRDVKSFNCKVKGIYPTSDVYRYTQSSTYGTDVIEKFADCDEAVMHIGNIASVIVKTINAGDTARGSSPAGCFIANQAAFWSDPNMSGPYNGNCSGSQICLCRKSKAGPPQPPLPNLAEKCSSLTANVRQLRWGQNLGVGVKGVIDSTNLYCIFSAVNDKYKKNVAISLDTCKAVKAGWVWKDCTTFTDMTKWTSVGDFYYLQNLIGCTTTADTAEETTVALREKEE